MQRVFQAKHHREASDRLAVTVAAAANVVPVAAWRQRTATETVTAGNAARNGAEILGFGEGPTFGGWVRWRVPARARLWWSVGRGPRRRCQHHMGLPNLAMLHRVQNGQKALADVRGQEGQPIQKLTIGGSRADQHRWHGNRRSRTGISRPLVAGSSEADRGPPEEPTP